ncbi:MAG: tail protein X, partial [Sphingomonadales bacterium]
CSSSARPAIIAQLGRAAPITRAAADDRLVRARAGESLDALIWRALGDAGLFAGGVVERTLIANPGLALIASALPEGHPVLLPDLDTAATAVAATLPLIQLWD